MEPQLLLFFERNFEGQSNFKIMRQQFTRISTWNFQIYALKSQSRLPEKYCVRRAVQMTTLNVKTHSSKVNSLSNQWVF